MLRCSMTLTIAAFALTAGLAHADVYKFTDANGNVQYTDKPATLPAERLNVQSQKTDVVAMQARQEAESKRMQDADATRQLNNAQQTVQKTAADQMAKDKAERCTKARERYDSYMTSQRLYQPGDNGERRYLTDAELTAARVSAKVSMDELCK